MKSLHITNFKSLVDVEVPLSNLTVLAGLNGAGKSSVIQILLALRQSFFSGDLSAGKLGVSGSLVDLGAPREVLSEGASTDQIGISVGGEEAQSVTFRFEVTRNGLSAEAPDREAHEQSLHFATLNTSTSSLFAGRTEAGGASLRFHYLDAERNGPRKFLPMSSAGRELLLGARGEFVLQALDELQDTVVLSEADPRKSPVASLTLRSQVEHWLGEISPGAQLSLESVSGADLIVGSFSFGAETELRSRNFRATNVGFGLSYVLPILVALLVTPRGGMVLLENPEAHLHPNGQTRLGELCAMAAAAGVQVIVETHSDHFLDGARIAVRDGIVQPSQVAFNYFSRRGSRTSIETPTIDPGGRLSHWPSNFFDQHRKNSARLVRPRG